MVAPPQGYTPNLTLAHEADHQDGGSDALSAAIAVAAIPSLAATILTSGDLATARYQTNVRAAIIAAITSMASGDILYYDGSTIVRLAKGSAGQKLQTGTPPSWVTVSAGKDYDDFQYIDLTTPILWVNDDEVVHNNTSFTKEKEVTLPTPLPNGMGTFETYFEMKTENSGENSQGRVYRDGGAVGTSRATTSTSYVTYTESIAGWSAGEAYQLYLSAIGDTYQHYARYFRILGELGVIMTNAMV